MGTHAIGLLLDLENLLHGCRCTGGAAVRAGLEMVVHRLAGLGPIHFAVGCCDHWLAGMLVPVADGLGVRVFPGPLGRDRADEALLRRSADVPPSVGTLVIGSGDHVFAPLAAAQRAAGRTVVVAARPGTLSAALAAAADHVVSLPLEAQERVIRIDAVPQRCQARPMPPARRQRRPALQPAAAAPAWG